jgi:hypothetical protein
MNRTLTLALTSVFLIATAPSIRAAEPPSLSRCTLHHSDGRYVGPCGALLAQFNHVPTIRIAQAMRITTGTWREGIRPTSVWSGEMSDDETRDDFIELSLYPGAWGILRTQYGWFPVTGIKESADTLSFNVYAFYEIAPDALDRKIVRRAATLLSATKVWNRNDNRVCPATATTWSIYCALEKATIEVTGGFHHGRPALQVVRLIVAQRSAGRHYDHLLMDYNNDPRTTLGDVQSLFSEALERMNDVRWLEDNGFARRAGDHFEPG